MLWEELTRIALIGTDRTQLSLEAKASLSALGLDPSMSPTQLVLEGAVLSALMQKAGRFPMQWSKDLPEKAPAEKGNPCSVKARNFLKLILKDERGELLSEFIHHLVKNKQLLPLDVIPELLDQSLRDPLLWEKLKPAIGQRGVWLISQNPEWQILDYQPELSIWETGTRAQRTLLLSSLRKSDPATVIPLIEETWGSDDLTSRVHFVKTLEKNVSLEDEDFLEKCLDNSRKEIRKPAAEILSAIPESKLCKRIFDQLTTAMDYKPKAVLKKTKLKIQLPDELTPEMLRDGIDPSSRWFKGGVKASRLGQMIGMVPPHFWEKHFNMNTEETLKLFVKTEWSELLLQALTEATIRHKNMEWVEAILVFWMDNFQKARWQYFNPIKLFDVVDEAVFNKIAVIYIKTKNSLVDEESPLSLLLRSVNLPWHKTLSEVFVYAMQKWIAGETSHYWSGWHLRPILKKAALFTDPKLLEKLTQGWSTRSNAWNSWQKDIESFLRTLKFRKDLIETLEKGTNQIEKT